MTIDKSKVLTCSARDYAESRGINLGNYDLVGMHCSSNSVEDFCREVPDNAEIVTDYQKSCGGIALILKGVGKVPINER